MSEGRGLRRALTIDGEDLRLPAGLEAQREIYVTDVDTDGDSIRYSRARKPGLPFLQDRYSFTLPYPTSNDDDLEQVAELQSEFGEMQFSYWKPIRAKYIAVAGQTDFWLPRRRRNAPSIFGEDESAYPFTCTRNGNTQIVTCIAGSSVSVPVDGVCNVAREAAASGARRDEVIFRLSACGAADVVRIKWYGAMLVRLIAGGESYPGGFREERELVFMER